MSAEHFENIILLRKNDARKALDILARDGKLAAVEYLKSWYHPGKSTVVSSKVKLKPRSSSGSCRSIMYGVVAESSPC